MDVYTLLFNLAIILLIGFIIGKLFERFALPDITGYILAGVIIGPYGLGLIDLAALAPLDVITKIVLGIIAYQIGTELFFPILKRNAGKLITITLVHAILTALIVFFGVYLFSQSLWLAFALAGLGVASAPAPVMAMIKKLRAKGPVKGTVVPVVGMLDIVAVIMFGLLASIATALVDDSMISIQNAIISPLIEVGASIAVGVLFGSVLGLASKLFIERAQKQERYVPYLVLTLSVVLGSVYLAERFHLSSILVPLTIGMTFTNFINKEAFMIQNAALSNFGGPFIVVFFTIAGLSLSPSVIFEAGLIAAVFVALRTIGKLSGTYIGATITRCPKTVRTETGWCLLPQAGVTIGMLVALSATLPEAETQLVQAVVLSSILIFQVFGPILMQRALVRANEVRS